ncbi:MAG: tripartite tricarboxylate transporter substrate-binding protein [Hyphomicrobiales bacterium]|nr:tripartite tricarboxylate transporter substrate-binding protein [Alphaproteobacteria bacterium]
MRNLIGALAFAVLAGMACAQAETYPSKPITVVIPLAAGGAVDTNVRIMLDTMRTILGQPILVENNGGAGGVTGINRVARAAPDGYTISVGTWGTHVVNAFIYATPYDLLQDFEPVALLPSVPHWFIARKTLPPKDFKEFVSYLKENDGKVTAASVGAGGSSAVCGYYFGKATGTRSTLVPYRGGAPALQDIVAGNVDMMCDLAANSLSQVKAGTIKAYAVTSKKRWFAMPDVPTADESGVPGVDLSNWLGAYAPKGTPKDVVAKLNQAFAAAMADPGVRARIADQGMEIPPPEQRSPEAFAAYLNAEMDKWGAVIRESGIKVQ